MSGGTIVVVVVLVVVVVVVDDVVVVVVVVVVDEVVVVVVVVTAWRWTLWQPNKRITHNKEKKGYVNFFINFRTKTIIAQIQNQKKIS